MPPLEPKAPTKSQKLHGPRPISPTYLWQRDIQWQFNIFWGEEKTKSD